MNLNAKITGITYTPFLCKDLPIYEFHDLESVLKNNTNFILSVNHQKMAFSQWVSPKRTRSYPYSRVYNTLKFSGKKVTIIPIIKDEGKQGDRDFLQWDTISLMSLLGIYTIIAYYDKAENSLRYEHKITNQRFNINYLKKEILKLLSYQSDALHWNLEHLKQVNKIATKALNAYASISKKLNVNMHSYEKAKKRIHELSKGKNRFMEFSRTLSKKAQQREYLTTQPKELVDGSKSALTISNYLGGYYHFTVDEVKMHGKTLQLIEAKHSRSSRIPSLEDIKDGLVKMIIFVNLNEVIINKNIYMTEATLKLTTDEIHKTKDLTTKQKETIKLLNKEATVNKFKIIYK